MHLLVLLKYPTSTFHDDVHLLEEGAWSKGDRWRQVAPRRSKHYFHQPLPPSPPLSLTHTHLRNTSIPRRTNKSELRRQSHPTQQQDVTTSPSQYLATSKVTIYNSRKPRDADGIQTSGFCQIERTRFQLSFPWKAAEMVIIPSGVDVAHWIIEEKEKRPP